MIYYGHYNEEGLYRGFFTKEVHGDNIDEPYIELTEEQWKEAISGRYKVVNGKHTYVAPPENEAEIKAYSILRSDRDALLSQSDWTQLADSPLTEDLKQAWAAYRQQLRDLPETVDIQNIVFPEPPK